MAHGGGFGHPGQHPGQPIVAQPQMGDGELKLIKKGLEIGNFLIVGKTNRGRTDVHDILSCLHVSLYLY